MIFPFIIQSARPNRYEHPNKDEDYHKEFGRYYISQANNPVLFRNMLRHVTNFRFCVGDQWFFPEDLEPFLMEETGDIRNRIKWVHDICKPVLKAYVNNASKNTFEVRAYNVSANRLDSLNQELSMRLTAHQMASAMPGLQQQFKSAYNLGNTPEETESNFNTEVDGKMDEGTNALFNTMERRFQLQSWKGKLAEDKCLAGINCIFDWYSNGSQTFERLDPAYFFYDVNAVKPDLTDGEYAGHINFMAYPDVCEKWPGLKPDVKETLERYSSSQVPKFWDVYMRLAGYQTNRIPTFTVTWLDVEVRKYGFLNFHGKPSLIRLDNKDPNQQPEIIDFNSLPAEQKKLVGPDGTISIEKQVPRYAIIIPREFISNNGEDIVLEFGEVPYAVSRKESFIESPLPYIFDTYDYKYGNTFTPFDTMIDVQRMINRYMSMMEATVNNAAGSNVFLDASLTTKDGRKANAIGADMRASKPILVDASRSGGNLQNQVANYSGLNAIEQGEQFMKVVTMLQAMQQTSSNVSSDLTGNSNPEALVGNQENNIEQGLFMQGDFIDGIAKTYYRVYWSIGNKGRRIMCDQETKLVAIVGQAMAQQFQFTKAMMNEDIYVAFRRVPAEQTNVDYVNSQLFSLLAQQLIGPKQFARLFNRAEMDEVSSAIREFLSEQQALNSQMQQESSQNQQAQEEKAQQMLQLQVQLQDQQRQDKQSLQTGKNQTKIMSDMIKGYNKIMVEKMRNRNQLFQKTA